MSAVHGLFRAGTRRWLRGLVLPALLVRALIPVGFMPTAGVGGLSIGLCPGEAALPPALAREALPGAHAAHQHAHPGGGPRPPAAPHHPGCLFAASGAAALMPALAAPTPALAALPRAQPFRVQCLFSRSVLRAHGPRGPPFPL